MSFSLVKKHGELQVKNYAYTKAYPLTDLTWG